MPGESIENIRVLFADNNLEVRKGICTALRHFGYRRIEETARYDEVEKAIVDDEIDLLVCDAKLDGENVAELIHEIRHGDIGSNPFLVSVLLSDDLSSENIRNLIDCGTDDVLAKPLSPGILADRIKALTWNRKGFVVTLDYIGPDRRSAPRADQQQVPILEVPNSLHFIAEGNTNLGRLQSEIDACAKNLESQRMTRQAYQIEYLANIVQPFCLDQDKANDDAIPFCERAIYFANDLKRQTFGTDLQHTAELCDSLIEVTTSILADISHAKAKDVRLLVELAKAINHAFANAEGVSEVAADISDTLAQRA